MERIKNRKLQEIIKKAKKSNLELQKMMKELEKEKATFIETNVVRYPICKPTKTKSITGIDYRGIDSKGEEFFWKVIPTVTYGDATAFDQDVLFGLFTIITDARKENNANYVEKIWFTTRHLCCDIMKKKAGNNLKRTEESLKRLRSMTIEAKNIYKNKGKRYSINDAFTLFRIILVEEQDPGSTGKEMIRKLNTVVLPENILHNLELKFAYRYSRNYYFSLKKYLAKRLYILFTFDFLSSNGAPIRFFYSTLCDQVPLKRKTEFLRVKNQCNDALEELKVTGFIKRYIWEMVNKKMSIFKLTVWPGKRFEKETENNKSRKQIAEQNSSAFLDLRKQMRLSQK